MIKDNQRQLNRLELVLDLLVIAGSYFLTFFLFFFVFSGDTFFGGTFNRIVTRENYELAILYLAPLEIILFWILKLYRPIRFTGRRKEAFSIFIGNLCSILIIVLVFWLFVKPYSLHFSRVFLFEFGIVETILLILERNLVRLVYVRLMKKGFNTKKILIVGYSASCETFLKRVSENARWGYLVKGILDDQKEVGTKFMDYAVIGKLSDLSELLSGNEIDEVFITLALDEYRKLKEIVNICEKNGVMTKFIPDYGNMMSNRPYTEELAGLPVIYIRQVPLNDMANAFIKRSMDLVGSVICLVLFSPVMLVTAILIKCTSKGPVFFKQERIGLHNKPFKMLKFRSMRLQTEEEEAKGWTTENDPRVTKIGKFIRKTSIDELPQLLNVLAGRMSLIGPRPERPQYVEKFKEEIPHYMVKHQVRPGMTGWAQVNGLRGDTSIAERINHDLYYIENWTPGLDIKILFLTVFKGFINKNAY